MEGEPMRSGGDSGRRRSPHGPSTSTPATRAVLEAISLSLM
jgi:hypothetical protein